MDEEIALWLREEEILQEALQESKREGIGKVQEQVTPLSKTTLYKSSSKLGGYAHKVVDTILASQNFYEVLQVPPKASKAEIRQSYRQAAKSLR